jgi:hypothetical protein
MEVDFSVQSEATVEYNLNAIKEFPSFTDYFIGEKLHQRNMLDQLKSDLLCSYFSIL